MARKSGGLAAAAVMAIVLAITTPVFAADSAATTTKATGPTYTYGTDNPFADARVEIHGVQTSTGMTITLDVSGIDPSVAGTTFPAHVHVGACTSNPADAGGHYKNDPSISTAVESNEVWLDFTVTPGGTAHARADRPWVFTRSAQSVVFHAPDKTRIVCTDAPFYS